MSEYRKKPVVVQAVRWNGKYSDPSEWPDWFRQAWEAFKLHFYLGGRRLAIEALGGQVVAEIGDYVICGVQGELYTCKPDIFAQTYELATEPDLQSRLAQAERERDNWIDEAGHHCDGAQFYKGLLRKIGSHFGDMAKTSDDGTLQEDVLSLKVPELVSAALQERGGLLARVESIRT